MGKNGIEFFVQIKSGKTSDALALVTGYHKAFIGHRFTWSTGEYVKRATFNPARPGDKIKAKKAIVEQAYNTLVHEGAQLSNATLKQRIELISTGTQWIGNELHIARKVRDSYDIEKYVIPDSVNRTALTQAIEKESLKKNPDFKKVVSRFLASGDNELFGFWDGILSGRIKPRSGKELRKSTIRAKRVTYGLVKQYNENLTFDHMTMKFYNEFTTWLKENDHDENSIGKHVKELKAVLNLAYRNELIDNDRFKFWPVARLKNEVIALTKEDIQAIQKLKLTGTIEDVRDLFIMACFLAPRIGDFPALNPESFTIKNGIMYFEYVSGKTGVLVRVPVPPHARVLIEKRWDNFPKMISEQNFRYALKEIAEKAGLNERVIVKIRDGKPQYTKKYLAVSPHTARRTAASNLYYGWFSKAMPASLCMRYTGHKSEKSFLVYIGAGEDDLNAKTLEYFDFQPKMKAV
jgi:integrase